MFNADQIKSFIRNIALFVGGFVVSKGWISNELMLEIAGGIAGLGATLWGLWFHAGNVKAELTAVAAGVAPSSVEAKVVAKAVKAEGIV